MTPEQYVQDKTAKSGSSFYYAFLFLPPPRRAAITAFYAFCREIDDIVDEVHDPGVAATKLAWWRREAASAFAGTPSHPVMQALMPHAPAYGIRLEHLGAVIDGCEMDLTQSRYLDYAGLEPTNPRLVYACITGYGLDGPYRDKPAMDPIIQAVSGLMARTGQQDGPPTRVGATIGDQLPGVWAALGILAALRQRDLDGRGQLVDVAMLDALLALSWDDPLDLYEDQGLPPRIGSGTPFVRNSSR